MANICQECGDPFKGRSDKKFCSDSCRNAFNNHFNRDSTNLMRRVNRTLRKNRNILEGLNPNGKSKTSKKVLLQKGFDFGFHTNTYTTKNGNTYYFCYEQGYLPLEKELFALVIKKEYV